MSISSNVHKVKMKIKKHYRPNNESKTNYIDDELENYEEPKKWYEEVSKIHFCLVRRLN